MHAFENYFSWIILLQVPGIQKKKKNPLLSRGSKSRGESNRQQECSMRSCADNGYQNIEKYREKASNLDLRMNKKSFSKEVMPS